MDLALDNLYGRYAIKQNKTILSYVGMVSCFLFLHWLPTRDLKKTLDENQRLLTATYSSFRLIEKSRWQGS